MLWLKCCSRCNGDLSQNNDEYGSYIACIQCGRYLTEAEELLLSYGERPAADRVVRLTSSETLPLAAAAEAMVVGIR